MSVAVSADTVPTKCEEAPPLEESSLRITPDGEEPTDKESQSLRHISDHIPLSSWMIAGISLCERFTYYGINSPLQNYAQNPLSDPLRPGALGLGESRATNVNDSFQFLIYLSPIGWAIIADTQFGRYKTICIAIAIYLIGANLIFATSTPDALRHDAGLGGLLCGMIAAGVGLGGLKACVPPFMAEQYTGFKSTIRTIKNDERVVIDRDLTLQAIYGLWYWCVNVGSLSGIATTFMERNIGFWAAYLLPACFLWLAVIILIFGRQRFVRKPPTGSVLRLSFKIFSYAIGGGFNMNTAKPDFQRIKRSRDVEWSESFVDELKLGLIACRVFLVFPVVWLCHSQINTNLVSQAAQTRTYGLPNDVFQNFSALTVIIAMPIMQKLIYPTLERARIPYPPINRITAGFVLQAGAMAYAAGLQRMIYNAGPCYDRPLHCVDSDGGAIPNHVSVGFQVPAYVLDGLGTALYYPTGQEYAYQKAPSSMKSFVQAVLMGTVALGAALAIALSQTYRDPKIMIMYASLAGLLFISACVFFFIFQKLNVADKDMNRLGAENEERHAAGIRGRDT